MSRREFIAYLSAAGLLAGCGPLGEKKRVMVVGAGLAGLAAGIELLERSGGDIEVDLIWQGHFLGGRATSWSEGDYLVGHGFHVMFDSYTALFDKLRRSGTDLSERLIPNDGHVLFYESRDATIHTARQGVQDYTGFTPEENESLTGWLVRNHEQIAYTDQYPELDNLAFDDWARSTGLRESLLQTNFFRYARDVFFNYPAPISAYTVLKFLQGGYRRLSSARGDAAAEQNQIYYFNGDMVENLIQPLADHFLRLGGRMTPRLQVRRLIHDGTRVSGVEVAEPLPPGTHCGTGQWPDGNIVTDDDTRAILDDHDGYVLAIPHTAVLELNPGDDAIWGEPMFDNLHQIQTGSSFSARFWCNEPVGTEQYTQVINGTPEPCAAVIDYRNILDRYADGRWASVIDTVGALNDYEDLSEQALLELVAEKIASIPGFENPLDCDPDFTWVRRNISDFGRIFLPLPGSHGYRPTAATMFGNFFLAGDYVRNSFDIPTMEGATRSGIEAAEALLAAL